MHYCIWRACITFSRRNGPGSKRKVQVGCRAPSPERDIPQTRRQNAPLYLSRRSFVGPLRLCSVHTRTHTRPPTRNWILVVWHTNSSDFADSQSEIKGERAPDAPHVNHPQKLKDTCQSAFRSPPEQLISQVLTDVFVSGGMEVTLRAKARE